jgi:hypothetical protein
VGDVTFTRPAVYVTVQQAEQEAADPTPASEHGWQEAVTSIYPLKINMLRITDGSLFYWDRATPTPVHLRRFWLRAENIRNVRSVAGRYPSPIDLEGELADGASFDFDGRADFLAKPSVTLRGAMQLRDLTLKGLAPALRAANVEARDGRLAATGRVERTATQTRLSLERVTLDQASIDYVQRDAQSERQLDKVTKAATTSEAKPATRVDVEEAVVRNATLGLVNRQAEPHYRVFVSDTDARVQHFSNQRSERRGEAVVTGRFMGEAPLHLEADFAPAARQADFRMKLRVEEVPLEKLNDVHRRREGQAVDLLGAGRAGWSGRGVRQAAVQRHGRLRSRAGREEGSVQAALRGAGRCRVHRAGEPPGRGRDGRRPVGADREPGRQHARRRARPAAERLHQRDQAGARASSPLNGVQPRRRCSRPSTTKFQSIRWSRTVWT